MKFLASPAVRVVLAACALRLAFAGCTGLGIDESYMVAASHHFAASYSDQPLASWWLELASRLLFGGNAPLIVRLPFVLLSALSSWLLHRLTSRLYGGRAAFWAVVAYSISPVFSLAFGCWVLPDGPLDAALLGFAYAFTRAVGVPDRPDPRWFLAAGLCAGLAMLSKYNAVLVLAGAALYLLADPAARPALRRWQPWAALLLAAALFSPALFWNAAHGWQSLDYQAGRATGLRLHPFAPLVIWAGEALFVLPWLWLPSVALMLGAFRRGPADRRGFLLAWLGVIPIFLFAAIGLWSRTRILYHWATPGSLMLLPLLGNWACRLRPAPRNAVAAGSAALLAAAALLITAQVQFGLIPHLNRRFPPGTSPLLQVVDWTSLRAQVPPGTVIAAQRWYDAGKIGYALPGATVTVFGPQPHQFGISAPPRRLPRP
jgi:4-amino-4-deoxy-L-arabinose transferase-like glycosyltransferase